MTLLTIVQDVCDAVLLTQPTSVIGNTEDTIVQLKQLTQLEGKALADEYDWDVLQTEATFTTVATESQGTVESIASGFKKMINETQWNRNIIYPVQGSMTPQQYQAYKANNFGLVYSNYRIRGGEFLMFPVPTAGQTIAFEYITKNWISNAAGDTSYSKWNADTDYAILDEDIITLGVIWRWLKAHNMDYAEEFRQYEIRKNNAMARDGGKLRKTLAPSADYNKPNLPNLPEGYWSI